MTHNTHNKQTGEQASDTQAAELARPYTDPALLEKLDKELAEERAYYERIGRLADEYAAQWPNHCAQCDGHGMHTSSECMGEFWGAPAYMQTSEPCPSCTLEGRCARCGAQIANFDDLSDDELDALLFDDEKLEALMQCSACGFRLGETGGMPLP